MPWPIGACYPLDQLKIVVYFWCKGPYKNSSGFVARVAVQPELCMTTQEVRPITRYIFDNQNIFLLNNCPQVAQAQWWPPPTATTPRPTVLEWIASVSSFQNTTTVNKNVLKKM